MAWTEFYLQTTGANTNSGHTSADSPSVTSTNGDWGNAAANRFTAAAGTPFSAATTADWVAIFLDGATVASMVGRITAINAGGASVDVSATERLGTAPANGATGRTAVMGGAWGSLAIATSSVFSAGTAGVPMRVNVKAGTYANTTTARTIAAAGAATAPIWWRGYNAAIGDLDADFTTAKPAWTWTTGNLTISSAQFILSNISVQITGASGAAAVIWSGTSGKMNRCRVEHQNANAGSSAITMGATISATSCYFKATTTATQVISVTAASQVHGSWIEGGVTGMTSASISHIVTNCTFLGATTRYINHNGAGFTLNVYGCTFLAGISASAIRLQGAPGMCAIMNNVFVDSGTYDIENSSGANFNSVNIANNVSYSPGTAFSLGFEDSAFSTVVASVNPVTSTSDPTLVASSEALAVALPGRFENTAFISYRDAGAVQHVDPAGSGGVNRAALPSGLSALG